MALTQKVELSLKDSGLTGLFNKSKATWLGMAKKAHAFVKESFPSNSLIRPDDVAEALVPVLEVQHELRTFLKVNRLRQKYWYRRFCDLILDRTWDELT